MPPNVGGFEWFVVKTHSNIKREWKQALFVFDIPFLLVILFHFKHSPTKSELPLGWIFDKHSTCLVK